MIWIDSHVHTDFSSDSDTPMEVMIDKAVSLGLKDICFTDHMDYGFPKKYPLPFTFNPSSYVEKIGQLKACHEPDITIRTGVELGLKLDVELNVKALLTKFNFDFVLGSVHIVNEMDPYYSEYWESFHSEQAGVQAYFETTLSCVELFDDFDSLGHLDYIIRYAPSKDNSYSYRQYYDVIDAVLEQCIQKGKSLEVNTSGYKSRSMPNPNRDILQRYRELGGELITIGSDAHTTDYLAFRFEQCSHLLKETGFRAYVAYHARKPVFYDL